MSLSGYNTLNMKNLLNIAFLALLASAPAMAGKLEPQYRACQGKDIERHATSRRKAQNAPKGKRSFTRELSEKVVRRIEDRLLEFSGLRACFEGGTDSRFCREIKEAYRANLKLYWSPMRVNLSLSWPALRGHDYGTLKTSSSYWFDKKPAHIIGDASPLAPLTGQEIKEAQDIFVEQVLLLPFRNREKFGFLDEATLKKSLLDNTFSPFRFGDLQESITIIKAIQTSKHKVMTSIEHIRESAKKEYFHILDNLPILSYLERESDIDDDGKLVSAFLKLESHLENLLLKTKSSSGREREDILLAFTPLVETLLSHRPELCSIAENLRVQFSNRAHSKMILYLSVGILSAAPCFFPGGAVLCLAGGLGVGGYGLHTAKQELAFFKQKALTGKDIQKFAELEPKERMVVMEKVLLPLAFWGTTAQSLVALKNTVNKIAIRNKAQGVLNRPLNPLESKALLAAHHIGRGEVGIDGQRAGVGNYTKAQILRKSKTLSSSGFGKQERRTLMESGIVGRGELPLLQEAFLSRLQAILKPEQKALVRGLLKDCSPHCIELQSRSSPAVFKIERDFHLDEPTVVFSEDLRTKTLKVPGDFFSDPSENFLRRWLVGHEFHPYNSMANGTLMEKPIQQEAIRAYDRSVDAGHNSFLHIAPTAVGKGVVLSKVLMKRLSKLKENKNIIFVTTDRIHLVDQIAKDIAHALGPESQSIKLINWNSMKEGQVNVDQVFTKEVQDAVNRDTPTVFFITTQSLKRRMEGIDIEDLGLDSLFFDEAHHFGALKTRDSLQRLLDENDAFLFGSTATPIHHEVNLTEMFDASHFSYLKPSELSESVSKKTLLQLSRSIERGDITGFDDLYVIGEPLFKGNKPLFVKERESGYRVLNPDHYSRLVEVLNPILESNRRGLIVTASIREADRLSAYLNDFFGGTIEFSPYHSQMGLKERREILRRSEEASGSHYIVSVRALDEGANLPRLSAYVDLNSNISVKQMLHRIGRVLRVKDGKLRSDMALLTDYKDRRMSEDLLELLEAMESVPGFRNVRGQSKELDLDSPAITRMELSASRNLLERTARSYWRSQGQFVDFETFTTRIKQAIERGELDPYSIIKSYRQWQKNHPDMPVHPHVSYSDEFSGWKKFLKSIGMATRVDFETFTIRIKPAIERGELDLHSISKSYKQWRKNHPDMPVNPYTSYPDHFSGWKKFLKNIGISTHLDFETFTIRIKEALERRELNPHNMKQSYQQWKKNYSDMPSNPLSVYRSQFQGWVQFLKSIGMATRVEKVDFETFSIQIKEALERGELDPHSMQNSYRQWQKNRPNMPSQPEHYYRNEFSGWRNFLNRIGASTMVDFGTFTIRIKQAIERGELNPYRMIESYQQWQKKHPDMPSKPFFRGQFQGWTQLLKSIGITTRVDFETFTIRIKEAIERGELKPHNMDASYRQWQKNYPDMPFNPHNFYRNEFPGWRKFLKSIGVTIKVNFETFTIRIKQAIERGELKPHNMDASYRQWQKNYPDMPFNPHNFYRNEFPGWRKFLKSIGVTIKVNFETFTIRIKQAIERGELNPYRMIEGYRQWQKSHPDMPSDPYVYYGDKFPGWSKLLESMGITSHSDPSLSLKHAA